MNPLMKLAPTLALLTTALAACTNGKSIKKVTVSASAQSTGFNFRINSAAVSSLPTGGNVTTLQVSAISGAGSFNNYCGGSNTCTCSYTWNYSGVNRFDTQTLSAASPTNAVCPVPLQWQEIPTGANVTIELASANNLMRAAPFLFTKGEGNTGVSVDFTDLSGRGYRNILRATVYEQQRTFKTIQNVKKVASRSTGSGSTEELRVHSAARFCPGGTSGVEGCEGQSETSSVSNLQIPYNVYYPASTAIPSSNERYLVSAVNDSNAYPADATFALSPTNFDGAIPIETNSRPTNPLDATTAPNTCRNGPIAGTLSNDRLASQCVGYASPTNSDGSCPTVQFQSRSVQMVRLRKFHTIYPLTIQVNGANTGKVLAQAQAVDTVLVADRVLERMGTGGSLEFLGTYRGPLPCPFSVYDKEGVTGYLSRWNSIAIDRPYKTRHGGVPRYVASNSSLWGSGATFDGTSYPNYDFFDATTENGSCSAVMPIFEKKPDRSLGVMGIRTAGIPANRRFDTAPFTCTTLDWRNGGSEGFPSFELGGVANVKTLGTAFEGTGGPFLPEWEEDTKFKACVLPSMQAQAPGDAIVRILDPPIHLVATDTYAPDVPVRDTAGALLSASANQRPTRTVAAYCAETLPTQNKQVDKLESPNYGYVKNYTSHKKANQVDTTPCAARLTSTLSSGYPPFGVANPTCEASTFVGWAHHGIAGGRDESVTCDKDVNLPFSDYPPLLQDAADTETSLKQRPNIYGCFITSGTAQYNYRDRGLRTPSMCCSPDVMNPAATGTGSHFEPGTQTYCGNARE